MSGEQQCCKLSELKGAVSEEVGNKSYSKISSDNAKIYIFLSVQFNLVRHVLIVSKNVLEIKICGLT